MDSLDFAREMRRHPTPPEQHLWRALRTWRLDALKFRRQVPMGRYIVDFYCASARLVVEVDGASHADNVDDIARDRWVAQRGLRVLRVWNNEVMGNLPGVLDVIRRSAAATPPPAPSRRGRGK